MMIKAAMDPANQMFSKSHLGVLVTGMEKSPRRTPPRATRKMASGSDMKRFRF
jgi:hypothetical protein